MYCRVSNALSTLPCQNCIARVRACELRPPIASAHERLHHSSIGAIHVLQWMVQSQSELVMCCRTYCQLSPPEQHKLRQTIIPASHPQQHHSSALLCPKTAMFHTHAHQAFCLFQPLRTHHKGKCSWDRRQPAHRQLQGEPCCRSAAPLMQTQSSRGPAPGRRAQGGGPPVAVWRVSPRGGVLLWPPDPGNP